MVSVANRNRNISIIINLVTLSNKIGVSSERFTKCPSSQVEGENLKSIEEVGCEHLSDHSKSKRFDKR